MQAFLQRRSLQRAPSSLNTEPEKNDGPSLERSCSLDCELLFPELLLTTVTAELDSLYSLAYQSKLATSDPEQIRSRNAPFQLAIARLFVQVLTVYREATFFPGIPPQNSPMLSLSAFAESRRMMLQSHGGGVNEKNVPDPFFSALCGSQAFSRFLQRHTSLYLAPFHRLSAAFAKEGVVGLTSEAFAAECCSSFSLKELFVPPPFETSLLKWRETFQTSSQGVSIPQRPLLKQTKDSRVWSSKEVAATLLLDEATACELESLLVTHKALPFIDDIGGDSNFLLEAEADVGHWGKFLSASDMEQTSLWLIAAIGVENDDRSCIYMPDFSSASARCAFVRVIQAQLLLSTGVCAPLRSDKPCCMQPLLGLGVQYLSSLRSCAGLCISFDDFESYQSRVAVISSAFLVLKVSSDRIERFISAFTLFLSECLEDKDFATASALVQALQFVVGEGSENSFRSSILAVLSQEPLFRTPEFWETLVVEIQFSNSLQLHFLSQFTPSSHRFPPLVYAAAKGYTNPHISLCESILAATNLMSRLDLPVGDVRAFVARMSVRYKLPSEDEHRMYARSSTPSLEQRTFAPSSALPLAPAQISVSVSEKHTIRSKENDYSPDKTFPFNPSVEPRAPIVQMPITEDITFSVDPAGEPRALKQLPPLHSPELADQGGLQPSADHCANKEGNIELVGAINGGVPLEQSPAVEQFLTDGAHSPATAHNDLRPISVDVVAGDLCAPIAPLEQETLLSAQVDTSAINSDTIANQSTQLTKSLPSDITSAQQHPQTTSFQNFTVLLGDAPQNLPLIPSLHEVEIASTLVRLRRLPPVPHDEESGKKKSVFSFSFSGPSADQPSLPDSTIQLSRIPAAIVLFDPAAASSRPQVQDYDNDFSFASLIRSHSQHSAHISCTSFQGHAAGASLTALHSDTSGGASRVAVGGSDGRVSIYCPLKRRVVHIYSEHNASLNSAGLLGNFVTSVKISGDLVASAGHDGTLRFSSFARYVALDSAEESLAADVPPQTPAKAPSAIASTPASGKRFRGLFLSSSTPASTPASTSAPLSALSLPGPASLHPPHRFATAVKVTAHFGNPVASLDVWQRPCEGENLSSALLPSESHYIAASGGTDGVVKVFSVDWRLSKNGIPSGSALEVSFMFFVVYLLNHFNLHQFPTNRSCLRTLDFTRPAAKSIR